MNADYQDTKIKSRVSGMPRSESDTPPFQSFIILINILILFLDHQHIVHHFQMLYVIKNFNVIEKIHLVLLFMASGHKHLELHQFEINLEIVEMKTNFLFQLLNVFIVLCPMKI